MGKLASGMREKTTEEGRRETQALFGEEFIIVALSIEGVIKRVRPRVSIQRSAKVFF